MILLVCDAYEPSVDEVIDWLNYFHQKFQRINSSDLIEDAQVGIEQKGKGEVVLWVSKKKVDFSQVKSYWYKRGVLKMIQRKIEDGQNNFGDIINTQVNSELYGLEYYLHTKLRRIPHIGSYFDNLINKPEVLQKAFDIGLAIPDTLITTKKEALLNFSEKYQNKIIAKGIRNGYYLDANDVRYYTHTIQVDYETINTYPESFVPTLFQEKLDKKYELRIFYLDGVCYSSVIFSQDDPQTQLDFRNYNRQKPNRVCPFKVPSKIEDQIGSLMNQMGFRSGSIDMVVTKKQEYVFLEINPVGQFKQVSLPCNYKLEKLIAGKLINTDEAKSLSTSQTAGRC
jgi:ATP-GRASP peptide maturase of grasp-with-spasm system